MNASGFFQHSHKENLQPFEHLRQPAESWWSTPCEAHPLLNFMLYVWKGFVKVFRRKRLGN